MEEIKIEEYKPAPTKIPFRSDKEYHVFLSFRGKDVRDTLVRDLYDALTAAKLNVFLDSHSLRKGEIIEKSLKRAIESSAIRIPIFSEGYASSAWCLKEAAAMLRTPDLIIPLFYQVDPTDVRYPVKDSSVYKQAFLKHYSHPERYQREEIDGWKDALYQICSRSGWSTDMTEGFEGQIVKMVVNDVIKTMDSVPLEVAKHPVGVDSSKNALLHKLNLNSERGVCKVGIWGIGGIGKTTAAKAVYKQISGDFDAASFVFNVRATAADAIGLPKLQKQILEDLTQYRGEVRSVDEGKGFFWGHLGRKRVLLILDDVDATEQSNALVGDWLAPGSKVIITSRDQHILNLAGVSSECIFKMRGLPINESLQLFSWHAFLRASPLPSHEDESKKIVKACKGHPLSLEVIGAFLYDKLNERGCWAEAADNITLHPEIHERLKISYSALSEEEKEIFLDIACFFIGEDKALPIIFWKSLYRRVHAAISNLSLKLLINIDHKGQFDMHDHLRDMGRSIAERKGTRLWNADHLGTISNNNNLSRLRLNGVNSQRLEMLSGPALRFLHLEDLPIDGITRAILPPSLIWLRLERCEKTSHFNAIQQSYHLNALDKFWELRIMQVDGDIFNFQYSFSNIIGNLSQLQHLNLNWCEKLNKLPDSIDKLSQLQHLNLEWCEKLNKLPDSIGNLSQLQHLNLRECFQLNKLPDSIGNLSQLRHLNLRGCEKLNKLSDSIGNLHNTRIWH